MILTATIIGALAIALAVAAIRTAPSGPHPVAIGGLFNLTGYGSFGGESSRDGFMMALEDAHATSSEVRAVIEDTHSDLKTAVSAATKLVQIDRAIAVIGPEWTEFGEAVSPVAVQSKAPFISPWVVAEAPFVKPPYYWSATPSDRSVHRALAAYMAEHKLGRISLVYMNNYWSMTNIGMFKEEVAAHPELQMISEAKLDPSTHDFRTVLAQIKEEHPDAIYVAMADDDSHGAFVAQARQLGITMPIASDPSRAGSPVMKQKYPQYMHGQLFAEQTPAARTDEFIAKYEVRFGKKPEAPSAAAAYDMTTIVIQAIRSGAKTSGQVISYLEDMPPYEGYSGTIAFDRDGHLPLRLAVVKTFDSKGAEKDAD